MHSLAADPFFDVAQRLEELAPDRVEFLGRWEERNPWNVGFGVAWGVPGAVVFVVSADGPVTCVLRRGHDLLAWSVHLLET